MLAKLISRTRRNHGLEHATIHVLSEKHPNRFSAQGNSTHNGFFLNIYGNLSDQEVSEAVHEAHKRMNAGEERLAVHPNCGTVLLTTAAMATLSSQAAFGFEMRRRGARELTPTILFNALPTAVLAAAVALIVSRPLGLYLQERYTTESDLGNLQVTGVNRIAPSPVTRIFQLLLGQSKSQTVRAYRVDTKG
jgi:hypothetical protein